MKRDEWLAMPTHGFWFTMGTAYPPYIRVCTECVRLRLDFFTEHQS